MSDLPLFLTPNAVQVPAHIVIGGVGGSSASTSSDVPGFSMICQEENLWCWAAVAQAVADWRGISLSQSEIASDHVARGGGLVCAAPLSGGAGGSCGECDPSPGGCEDEHSLGKVLKGLSRLADTPASGPPSFQDIVDAIDAQRPLPVRIRWSTGNGHFICVSGYRVGSAGDSWVRVHDPLSPGIGAGAVSDSEIRYNTFVSGYAAASSVTGVPDFSYEVK